MKSNSRLYALIAALLFGASAPLSKLLLDDIPPIQLAGLLYLGSGVVLLLLKVLQISLFKSRVEAGLQKTDLPWLIGAVLSGGVLAPAILMFGLSTTPAATTSILLNFEAAATTLVAFLIFREHVSKRVVVALTFLTFASIILAFNASGKFGISTGALLVLLACILWGVDNNFTRNISSKDPVIIVIIKGIGAGSFSFILSLLTGSHLPSLSHALVAMLFGALCYGTSLLLFILALRGLGSARASALFATAPFIGAALSILVCKEIPTIRFFISISFMLLGTFLLFRESHAHSHTHEPTVHEHIHAHTDEHHKHEHDAMAPNEKKHSHMHQHDSIVHFHNHMPDIHHRHGHD